MERRRLDEELSSVAALEDPVRRALYLYVGSQTGEVGRDDAARAVHVSRSLAAFHLDKLVRAGLLEATFRRLSERRGPGAGRPSKLYRRSPRQIEVTLPERRYELAARLMARALERSATEPAVEALHRAAREWGERLGERARAGDGAEAGPGERLARAMDALREAGFEPRPDDRGGIDLANCPFHALAKQSTALVCGMNHALLEGVVSGLGLEGMSARLDPRPGLCCVAIRPERAS